MKWLFKWMLRLVIIVLAIGILAFAFKDSILRRIVEHRIYARTGMGVHIGRISSSLWDSVITVQNLKIFNPPGFGGGAFLNVRELHIECDPVALARKRVHIISMRLNVADVDIVQNARGQTNIFSVANQIKRLRHQGRHDKLEDFEFGGIDVLNLTLDRARFIDQANLRRSRDFPLNIRNQVIKNINSEADAYGLLLLLWLRSGGGVGMPPADFARSYLDDKLGSGTGNSQHHTRTPGSESSRNSK